MESAPSLPAGGFSPLSPPPSPRSLCQLSTRPRPSRANSRWRPHYEFRFFSTIQPPACRLHVKTLSSKSAVSVSALWRLRAVFSHCSSLFYSAVLIADLVVYRKPLRSAASASKPPGAMPPALRSRLSTFVEECRPSSGKLAMQNVFR